MWLFSRKAKAPNVATPEIPVPELASGPQRMRRIEITVEREWTSTITRRRAGEIPAAPGDARPHPAEGKVELHKPDGDEP